jgi:hypothetical protein
MGVSAWKEVGVDLHGYATLGEQATVSFDLYTVNGLGEGGNLRDSRQYRDNNEDKAFGARAMVLLSGHTEFGVSVYNGAWDDEGDHDLTMLGVHCLLATPLVDLHAEFADASSENPGGFADGEMQGYFVQASRRFQERYRATARYGALDYLDRAETETGRDPAEGNKDLTEFALGFNFSPTPDLVFKVEYTIFGEGDRMPDVDNNQIGFQAAVNF